jgi:tetraprenyl-beta-curcumene synthase
VLVGTAAHQLALGLSAVAGEVHAWRRRARTSPDAPLREDALSSLADKRGHSDGAALFWTLPRTRSTNLLRLLVAYEVIWDFLDSINERGAMAGEANGRRLHLALVDALDCERPVCDYYRLHPWQDDGGYLRTLVVSCRAHCAALPSYERVRARLRTEAIRAQVLAINHDTDPDRRDANLRAWAADEFPGGCEASWFELTGAASASLTVHVLLALAADELCTESEIVQAHGAYFPWISAATTMLDSFVDQLEDAENGDHSYVAHYPSPALAAVRMRELVRRSLSEVDALRDPERHRLIVACMAAMYLSKDSAHSRTLRATSWSLVASGGSLTRLLLPVLRLWRIAYAQRST